MVRFLIQFACFTILFCSSCSQNKSRHSITNPTIDNPLFVFIGESNSGGYASNAEASRKDLSSHTRVFIFNPISHGFEPLHIGQNNNIGHSGLDNSTHGWELQLANKIENNEIPWKTLHIVKGGQGGTRIADWDKNKIYQKVVPYTELNNRIDEALRIDSTFDIVILYSQGINDINDGNSVFLWKGKTLNLFDRIRNKYGNNIPIVMTCFGFIGFTKYNSAIQNICDQREYTYYINTYNFSSRDDKHWDYQGLKSCVNAMLDTISSHFVLRSN